MEEIPFHSSLMICYDFFFKKRIFSQCQANIKKMWSVRTSYKAVFCWSPILCHWHSSQCLTLTLWLKVWILSNFLLYLLDLEQCLAKWEIHNPSIKVGVVDPDITFLFLGRWMDRGELSRMLALKTQLQMEDLILHFTDGLIIYWPSKLVLPQIDIIFNTERIYAYNGIQYLSNDIIFNHIQTIKMAYKHWWTISTDKTFNELLFPKIKWNPPFGYLIHC